MKSALFVIRGMLGASIGGVIWMFLPAILQGALSDAGGFGLLVFWYLRLVLWIIAGFGGLIALAICIVHWATQKDLPLLVRVCIAILIAIIPMALLVLANGEPLSLFNLWYPLFFGITVGGFAGLLVGSPKRLDSSAAVEQIVGRERR